MKHEDTKKTAVTKINEYCQKYKRTVTFRETNSSPPFECTCVIDSHKEKGCGSSKKEAKHEAAFKMLQKLQIECKISDPINLSHHVNNKVIFKSSYIKKSIPIFLENETQFSIMDSSNHKVDDVNSGFKSKSSSQTLLSLQSTDLNNNLDFVDYFIKIVTEIGLKYNYESLESKYEDQFVVFINVDRNSLVAAGEGQSLEDAIAEACKTAIKMFVCFNK